MQTATRQIPIIIKGCILTYDKTRQGNIENSPDYQINDIRDMVIYTIPDSISILGEEIPIDAGESHLLKAQEEGWTLIGIREDEEWECIIEATGIFDVSNIIPKGTWMDKKCLWDMCAIIIECQGIEYKARNYPARWDINRP